MRTISRPDFALKTWIASGATTASVNRDIRPSLIENASRVWRQLDASSGFLQPLRLIK